MPKHDQRPDSTTLTIAAHIIAALSAGALPVFRMDEGDGGSLIITLGESIWQAQGTQVTITPPSA